MPRLEIVSVAARGCWPSRAASVGHQRSAPGCCWPHCRRSPRCRFHHRSSFRISSSRGWDSPRLPPPPRPHSSVPPAASSHLGAAADGRSLPRCSPHCPLGRNPLPASSFPERKKNTVVYKAVIKHSLNSPEMRKTSTNNAGTKECGMH